MTPHGIGAAAAELAESGVVRSPERFVDRSEVDEYLGELLTVVAAGKAPSGPAPVPLAAIELPAPGGVGQARFQALHFDFGAPLVCAGTVDVVRFTALYVPADREPPTARTRVVALGPLLSQRAWPARDRVLELLEDYAKSHGSWLGWNGQAGYREALLARIVDALDCEPTLLSYRELERSQWMDASLGGNEFATPGEEEEFFAQHGLDLCAVEQRILTEPGELLVFDNLAVAHGRLGRRAPAEIVQLTFGDRSADARTQRGRRDRVLASFGPQPESAPSSSALADASSVTAVSTKR